MLIFEPRTSQIGWYAPGEGGRTPASGEFNLAPALPPAVAVALQNATTVGYILRHGGAEFTEPVSRLMPETLSRLEACTPFLPVANGLTLELARVGLSRQPQAAHHVFCETAFFASLPAAASAYALPYEFFREGVRRYGGDGLCHQWVWRQVVARLGPAVRRVVSLHLGDYPSVAAIRDGRPAETSMGFSPLEGLPSATGCGDIDPTIVLLLRSAGLTGQEISRQLSEESGFGALLGHRAGWADLLAEDSPAAQAARALLKSALVKAVGANLASLGGADALAFAVEGSPAASHAFVADICRELDFLGLDVTPDNAPSAEASPQPPVRVVELSYQRAAMLAELLVA